jgi:hypothetical protein
VWRSSNAGSRRRWCERLQHRRSKPNENHLRVLQGRALSVCC